MGEPRISAEAFAAAVDRVCAHRTRPVVVKLGGSAMEDPAATDAGLRSVAALHRLGVPLALVHGGGKPIDRAMADAGLAPKKVAGRRYTDDATLDIVVRVLGALNADLARRLETLGCRARACPPSPSYPLLGERLSLPGPDGRPIDLGRVGTVAREHADGSLAALLTQGVLVIPSLARDGAGGWLNVNADSAASGVARLVGAERVVFLTDTPGVLRDRADLGSLLSQLSEREARDLIRSGAIDGGMVPKVEACFEALAAGARAALILDGRVPYALLDVFLRDTFTGTAITR